jgi:hypothetical protein
MALDRDAILVENLRSSLDLYQRSLVWAMTASAAFFVLTFSLSDPSSSVTVLYGTLSGPAAWYIALALFFVLGVLAGSALRNAEAVIAAMRVDHEVLRAALLYPSLATSGNGFIRIGTVVFCPLVVWIGFGWELYLEAATSARRGVEFWMGLAFFGLITAGPYAAIVTQVWHQVGSRPRRPLYPAKEPAVL